MDAEESNSKIAALVQDATAKQLDLQSTLNEISVIVRAQLPQGHELAGHTYYTKEQLQILRERDPRAFEKWNATEEEYLEYFVECGLDLHIISKILLRSQKSLNARLKLIHPEPTTSPGSLLNGKEFQKEYTRIERGPQSLNTFGTVNPPPTDDIAGDTI